MKRRVILFLILVGIIVGGGLWWKGRGDGGKETMAYEDITVGEFDALRQKEGVFVVDVHVPEQEHLPGTDVWIDYSQVGERLGELPADKNTEILVYCRSGGMSEEAAKTLAAAGYKQVKNLVGGVRAWKEAHVGVEMEPKTVDLGTVIYGEVARTEFNLINNTETAVKVTRVSTSCGCTKAEVEKRELAAGESEKVKVSFDPAVHKDDSDLGEVTRTVYIETDKENFREVTATIKAKVVKR